MIYYVKGMKLKEDIFIQIYQHEHFIGCLILQQIEPIYFIYQTKNIKI